MSAGTPNNSHVERSNGLRKVKSVNYCTQRFKNTGNKRCVKLRLNKDIYAYKIAKFFFFPLMTLLLLFFVTYLNESAVTDAGVQNRGKFHSFSN